MKNRQNIWKCQFQFIAESICDLMHANIARIDRKRYVSSLLNAVWLLLLPRKEDYHFFVVVAISDEDQTQFLRFDCLVVIYCWGSSVYFVPFEYSTWGFHDVCVHSFNVSARLPRITNRSTSISCVLMTPDSPWVDCRFQLFLICIEWDVEIATKHIFARTMDAIRLIFKIRRRETKMCFFRGFCLSADMPNRQFSVFAFRKIYLNCVKYESEFGMLFCSTFGFNVWLINLYEQRTHIRVCVCALRTPEHGKTIESIFVFEFRGTRPQIDRARALLGSFWIVWITHFYLFFAATNSWRLTRIIFYISVCV